MNKIVNEFCDKKTDKPLLWLRYIDNIYFIWLKLEDKLEGFLQRLNLFHFNHKFTNEYFQESFHFLEVVVKLRTIAC